MSDSVPPAARYRRFAWQCLEVAYTFPAGDNRAVLFQMAQVWQRLADQQEHSSTFLLFEPHAGERPAMQQQQQSQPDDEKE